MYEWDISQDFPCIMHMYHTFNDLITKCKKCTQQGILGKDKYKCEVQMSHKCRRNIKKLNLSDTGCENMSRRHHQVI